MANLTRTRQMDIKSVSDIESKYPNLFKYLMAKQPTSISFLAWGIELQFTQTGCKLSYDMDDIYYLNMLQESVNLTPKE